jgi:hypothetical protein
VKACSLPALTILALLLAPAARAEGLDTSKPLACTFAEAAQCDGVADCTDVTLEQIELPEEWRVDFAA